MRWIYLSPHYDDAVLSCGGLIYEQAHQGLPVEIWTVFSGSPPPGPLSDFALETHAMWKSGNGPETIALREAEDREAARRVGAGRRQLGFQDCIYRRASRRGQPLYPETVFAEPHPADRKLPGHIARALRFELRQTDRLVCPLALGGHVDHVLVRRAAESLHRTLSYYADVPYILNYPQAFSTATSGMESEHFGITAEGQRAWWLGITAYASQLSSLYKGEGTLEESMHAYWAAAEGLRLWRRRAI
jgi:LmbE family N-acetylglucosaminyl deacetylase